VLYCFSDHYAIHYLPHRSEERQEISQQTPGVLPWEHLLKPASKCYTNGISCVPKSQVCNFTHATRIMNEAGRRRKWIQMDKYILTAVPSFVQCMAGPVNTMTIGVLCGSRESLLSLRRLHPVTRVCCAGPASHF
jgi:hypothetical protein